MADRCKNVVVINSAGNSGGGFVCGECLVGGVVICDTCFSRVVELSGACGELGGALRKAEFAARTGVPDDYVPDNLG